MTNPDLPRRRLAQRLASLAALSTLLHRAAAQKPPTPCCPGDCCPTSIVVPFAAGGIADFVARALAKVLEPDFRTTVVIDNKAGVGGMIGAASVAQGTKHGGQALLATGSAIFYSLLLQKAPIRFATDLRPVSMIGTLPFVILVPSSSPLGTVPDLVKALKVSPGKLTFASNGYGTISHLSGAQFLQSAGASASHVPYRGTNVALTDVQSGAIDFGFFDIGVAAEAVRQGTFRALGVGSSQRTNLLPSVPTIQEQGQENFEAIEWFGLYLAIGVPNASSLRWQTAVAAAIASPNFRAQLESRGVSSQAISLDAFAEFVNRQASKWSSVAQRAGIKLD